MICIPIMARNNSEALEKIARAELLADVLEIRLDVMESFDQKMIIQSTSKPVIITYRSKREGGSGSADSQTQTHYLLDAIKSGADFVDVEYSMPLEFRHKIFQRRSSSAIIVSAHLRNGTPPREKLKGIFRRMAAMGADVVKIVTLARRPEDNLEVLNLIPLADKMGVKIIAFCMGQMGRISRIFCLIMGSYLSFASLEKGEGSADGQITIKEMRKILEVIGR